MSHSDRPILFSAPMVRALLRETTEPGTGKTMTRRVLKPQPPENWVPDPKYPCDRTIYHPGMRLWVREAWRINVTPDDHSQTFIEYRADDPRPDADILPWKPSIFMARDDSRLTLEVTAVRAERLQQISTEDCKREGMVFASAQSWWYADPRISLHHSTARAAFQAIWGGINGAASWDANPFVVVISFKPYLCNIDRMAPRQVPAPGWHAGFPPEPNENVC